MSNKAPFMVSVPNVNGSDEQFSKLEELLDLAVVAGIEMLFEFHTGSSTEKRTEFIKRMNYLAER